jgi:uncharacterized protein YjiS (DUF1127 family)
MNSEAVEPELKVGASEVVVAAPRHALPLRALAALGTGLAKWWRSYRGEAAVMNARDDMLKDMGLTRAEIEHWIGGRPYL